MNLLKNKLQILITLIFLGYLGWWISFQQVLADQGKTTQWFGSTYAVMALIGAVVGLVASLKWGGYKTVLGKALMFFSLGLLAQEAGQLISTYYVYSAHLESIPYPSWGDVAYFGSTLSYLCGAIFLSKAVGVKISLKANKAKIVAFIIPAILLAVSYWIFLYNHKYDWRNPLTVFLDLGYPLGDALYISMGIVAFLLSRKMLGGIMRAGILILIFALLAQYIADFSFLYKTSRGSYVPSGQTDLTYLIAYFIMTTAMVKFLAIYNDLRHKTATQVKDGETQGEGA